MLRKPLAVLAMVLALAVGRAAGQSQYAPGGNLTVLGAYLDALRQQAGIPGLSAAVVQDGGIIWEQGFGFQNVAARIRATPDTPYLVGDISQTIAATLALQCVEQRELTLDDPFSRFGLTLPEPEATLRQLLSHATPATTPDVPFAYSPARYDAVTQAVEHCAPQPYRKSVAHRILKRLAMQDSVPGTDLGNPDLVLPEGLFDPADIDHYREVLARMAVPYKVDGRGRPQPTEVPIVPMSAAGGLVSTVRDLAQFQTALTSDVLLLDTTLQLAWTPAIGRGGAPLPTGLGWFVQSYRGEPVVWHFGSVPNAYSSLVLTLPQRKLTLILLANSDRLSTPFQLADGDVTKSVFALLFLRLTTNTPS